ncbi:MAG: enoyl-CoA hydratase/isomerase family protein [Myxococcales bacterium]|nr:enoyl-CoA hydratase/isomerase family protein [Myxococcales bacterium]
MPDILFEHKDHVTTVTLNRPDRLNAISGEMLTRLSEGLIECDQDPEVRVLLLTGAGRGFCSGLDLKDVAGGSADITGSDGTAGALKIGQTPPFVLHRIDTPVICALNGPASGYGMDLALGCDMVIASDRAQLAPPVRRGVVPESGGTWLLPRLIGWHKACEVTLLARRLDAAELERLGLVNRVVAHDELREEALRWAQELARNAPLAVAAAKRSMRLGLESSFDANAYHVMAELLQLFRTQDFREGIASFMEKRDPRYTGR